MNQTQPDGPGENRAEPQHPNQQSSQEEDDIPAWLDDELSIIAEQEKGKTPSFSAWLKAQEGRKDVVGDLSRYLSQDPDFSLDPWKACCISEETDEALRTAWLEYMIRPFKPEPTTGSLIGVRWESK